MKFFLSFAARFSILFVIFLYITTIAVVTVYSEEISEPEKDLVPSKEATVETVKIGGKEFVVPFPWTGNRLQAPKFTYSDFKQIPVKHCKNNSKIYILATAYEKLQEMLNAALEDGILLQVESGYRSIGYQKVIFMQKLKKGRTFEDIVRYVAPPGYSQHMLGIAVDFSPSNWSFASTKQYQWLKENGHKYQFEETYSEFNEAQIPWEAWHWSYVGD